jgi:hypothetical protein
MALSNCPASSLSPNRPAPVESSSVDAELLFDPARSVS